jgi:hypothetical protein
VTRRLGLKGDQFDLEDLVDAFGHGDPRVIRDEGSYFLVAEEFAKFRDDHVGLLTRAREMLGQMDGAALLARGGHRQVEVDGSIHDPDGRQHAVVAADTVEVRARVSAVAVLVGNSGTGEAPTVSPARAAIDAAATNSSAAAALRLLGKGPLDWANLYRILDYMAYECGGKTGIVNSGLATKDEIDRFGVSANRIEISGDAARHGPSKNAPPTRSMPLDEGRAFISRLVSDWLKTL